MGKKKILLVEDNLVESKLLSKLLGRDYEVETAVNGLRALEKLKTFPPDLIVLDINMPVMNGLDFYNKILDNNSNPIYPVYVLTSRTDLKNLFRDFHVKGFMVKPPDTKKAVDEIKDIVEGRIEDPKDWLKNYDRVLIIDHDQESVDAFTKVFKDANFKSVMHATTAVEGIELAISKNPKLILVQLSLPDIEGDIAILRMTQMFKTSNNKFFLITPRDFERKRKVMDRLQDKSGVIKLIQYTKHSDVLHELEEIFKKRAQQSPHDKENEVLLEMMMESFRKRNIGGGFNA